MHAAVTDDLDGSAEPLGANVPDFASAISLKNSRPLCARPEAVKLGKIGRRRRRSPRGLAVPRHEKPQPLALLWQGTWRSPIPYFPPHARPRYTRAMRSFPRPVSYALLAALFLAVSLTGCTSGPTPMTRADRVVLDQTARIHTAVAPAGMLEQDPQLREYFKEVSNRLVAVARRWDWSKWGPDAHFQKPAEWMFSQNMQFHLMDAHPVNAFTTGGEHVYIYNDIFQTCQSEDELAAVMAHEYAHIYARHVRVLEPPVRDDPTAFELAAPYFQPTRRYTAADEQQADALGYEFYSRAGWNPARYAAVLQRFDPGRGKSLPPGRPEWRQPQIADDRSFADLKLSALNIANRNASSSPAPAVANAQLLLAAFPSCFGPDGQPEQQQAQARVKDLLRPPPDTTYREGNGPPARRTRQQ